MSARNTWIRIRARVYRLLGLVRARDIQEVRPLPGWLASRDAILLYDALSSLDVPGDVVEIGTYKGKSCILLARALQRRRSTRRLWTIDPHEPGFLSGAPSTWEAFQSNLQRMGVADTVRPLRMTSVEGAALLAKDGVRIAFLYIDGRHDEAGVVEDLEVFLPLMAPNAIVAMDDAQPKGRHPDVYRAYQRILAPLARNERWGTNILMVNVPAAAATSNASGGNLA